jgi:hypothetical protein
METNTPPMPRRRGWKRWIKWIAIGVGAFVLILILSLSTIIRAIIRHEIQSAVAGSLNATLVIDDLTYHPLLGVSISHAHLTMPGPDGSAIPIAELGGLEVSLAKMPFGGPIVVDNFTLVDPVIDLVLLPSGEYQIEQNLLRPSQPDVTSSASRKTSDLIQVRHFAINNLIVQERSLSDSAPPRVWGRLDANVDLNATGPADYNFHITLANQPLANLSLDGSLDADGYGLNLKKTTLTAQMPGGDAMGQLPPELAAVCRAYHLAGDGVTVSFSDAAALQLDLAKNHWTLHGMRGEMTLTSQTGSQSGQILFSASGGGPLSGPAGWEYLSSLDPDSVVRISADPNAALTLRSPLLPSPITNATGTIELSGGTLSLKSVKGQYGSQAIQLEATAKLLADRAELHGLRMDVAGGAVLVDSATFGVAVPHNYLAHVSCEQIDLRRVKDLIQLNDPEGHLSGTAAGNLNAYGTIPSTGSLLRALRADGKVHVENGDFYDIPFLRDVAGKVVPDLGGISRVGAAAAVYNVNAGTLHFSKMAVSCPAIGIRGSGDVGLTGDHRLNLNLVVAPLGDWKKQVQKTGIPLLSQIAGSVEKVFTQASEKLYSFHVTGPAANPSVVPEAAPTLTAASKKVFGQMLDATQGGLLDLIQQVKDDTSK